MGQMAMTIAGAVIGSVIPGVGTAVGAMIGGAIGGALFAPTIKGPRLTDLTVTASTYGNEIPRLYGTMRLAGNVIWSAGIKETKKKKSAGKGGAKQTTYTYSCSFAVAFCQGPVDKVLRIWADSKVIEVSGFRGLTGAAIGDFIAAKFGKKSGVKVRFYAGDDEQLPDSVIETTLGAGNAPAYRGLCYLVFENLPLEDYGNRIPSITAELSASVLDELKSFDFPSSGGAGGRYVDWLNRRAVRSGGGETITYNVDTGEEMYRFPGDAGGSVTMGANGGPIMASIDNSNTQRYRLYYPSTGVSRVLGESSRGLSWGAFGRFTRGLGSSLQTSGAATSNTWGLPFGSDAWLFPVPTLGGQKYAFIHQSDWNSSITHIFDEFGGYYHAYNPPFRCNDFMLGDIDTETTVWGWGNGANGGGFGIVGKGLQLIRYKIGERASYPIGQPYAWQMYQGALSYKTYILTREGVPTGYLQWDMVGDNGLYCPSDNSFVFTGDFRKTGQTSVRWFGKYSFNDKKWVYVRVGADYAPTRGGRWSTANHRDSTIGYIAAVGTGGRFKVIDLSTGMIVTDMALAGGNVQMGSSWDHDSKSLVRWNGYSNFRREGVGSSGQSLVVSAVVTDICERTGLLTADDLDTTELGDETITGFVMSRGTAKGSLQILASAYLFDGVESDFKIKFRKRGGASQMTIPQERISWVEEGKLYNETRTQEVELPARLTIAFRDPARDYQTGTQHAKRLIGPVATAFTRTETQSEFAMAFTATQAKQLADKLLKSAWRNRTSIDLSLPWEFVVLDPADVVTLALDDGTLFSLRVAQMQQGADNTLSVNLVTESQTSYISTEEAAEPNNFVSQPLPSNMPVKLLIMNTPLLRDEDDTQGVRSVLYVAAYQESNAPFAGSVIMQSTTGDEYDDIDFVSDDPYTGFVIQTLKPTSAWGATDTESELIVKMWNMNEDITLSSISYEELLAGGNSALCGDEVIQFQNAVLISGDQYKLTNILRARRGTNMHVNDHVTGERFVMLDPAYISKNERGPADFEVRRFFKAVRIGQVAEDTIGTEMELRPNDLKPYTPENVKVLEVDDQVTVSWSRRSRITAPMVDGTAEIHYKEGLGLLASFGYRLHKDRDLEDSPWNSYTPDTPTGRVPFYDTANSLQPFEVTFPLADVISTDTGSFVLELWENGFVEGVHKIVQFTRVSPNQWNTTELY